MSYIASVKALYIIATSQDTTRFKDVPSVFSTYHPLAYIVSLLTSKRDEFERLYLVLYRSEFLLYL